MATNSPRLETFDHDFNRALAARFAPKAKRRDLLLLLCFDRELSRIKHQTSQELLARMRTQFWRDTLLDNRKDVSPLAADLIETVERVEGLQQVFLQFIDTHEELNAENPVGAQITTLKQRRETQLFELAIQICLAEGSGSERDLLEQSGRLYALVLDEIRGSGEGGCSLQAYADRWRQTARQLVDVPVEARPALLPLALIPPYLNLLQDAKDHDDQINGREQKGGATDLSPFKKLWTMWRVMRNGF